MSITYLPFEIWNIIIEFDPVCIKSLILTSRICNNVIERYKKIKMININPTMICDIKGIYELNNIKCLHCRFYNFIKLCTKIDKKIEFDGCACSYDCTLNQYEECEVCNVIRCKECIHYCELCGDLCEKHILKGFKCVKCKGPSCIKHAIKCCQKCKKGLMFCNCCSYDENIVLCTCTDGDAVPVNSFTYN